MEAIVHIAWQALKLALWVLDFVSNFIGGRPRPPTSGEDWFKRDLP